MTAYRMSGGNIYVAKDVDMQVTHTLPPAIYQLNSDPMFGYFLSNHSECFSLPSKLYGDTTDMTQRIMHTFFDRPVSTGVLTANNEYEINNHLYSRPGRVFYRLNYSGLSDKVVTDYCQERLHNSKHLNGIVALSKYYDEDFNFDMLQALVEELNRYPNDTIQTVTSLLNFKVRSDVKYTISKVVANGELVDVMDDREYRNIFDSSISTYLNIPQQYWIPLREDEDKEDQETYMHVVLDTSMLTSYSGLNNTAYFTFVKQHGDHTISYEIEFSPVKPKSLFNITNML